MNPAADLVTRQLAGKDLLEPRDFLLEERQRLYPSLRLLVQRGNGSLKVFDRLASLSSDSCRARRERQDSGVVANSLPQGSLKDGLISHLEATLLQRPEGAHEIAAVHGRHKKRLDGRESLRVVPIEEVPVTPRQALCGFESAFRLTNEFRQRHETKVVGSQACVQQHAQIRGREAVGQHGRIFLKVSRNQPIRLSVAEHPEETPGGERGTAEKLLVLLRDCGSLVAQRSVEPAREQFRAGPEDQHRQGYWQGPGAKDGESQADHERNDGHEIQIHVHHGLAL